MNNRQEPNWQPIINLPMISGMIDGQVADTKKQFKNLLGAHKKPYILDDATIQHTIKVYTEQLDFIWIYEKQLSKWQKEERLIDTQQNEIIRLQGQVEQWKNILNDILSLAEDLKSETIEKVMEKSDLELGIEFLGKFQKY